MGATFNSVVSTPGGPVSNKNILGGGTSGFRTVFSGAPNAAISRPKVTLPSRGDYGAPIAAPTVADPSRDNYGKASALDARRLNQFAGDARKANFEFFNPRQSGAFKELMGLAQEQTGRQVGERQRQAKDAAQRRGYAGGADAEGREAEYDQMEALASAGFEGAGKIRESASAHYGAAASAFTALQASFNEAKSAGDIAFARDLTATHLANAENVLKSAGLNMEQQTAFASGLNEARMLQAKLDQDYNGSLIDNNRYIEAQQQIAAQLMAQQMALAEKAREFDAENLFRSNQLEEERRRFDLGLKANPNTALRTFDDPRYGGSTGRKTQPFKGSVFTGLS